MLLVLAASVVFILVAGFVGIRLILLGRRTRGLPETSLGLGLLLIVGLGYSCSLAGGALVAAGSDAAGRWLYAASAVLMTTGWMFTWLFTWRVFRPGSTAATAVSSAALGGFVGFCAIQLWRLSNEAYMPGYGTHWSNLGTQVLALGCYVWAGTEAFRYASLMRRRLALGLADPVVLNRFVLWGYTMVFSFGSLIGSTVAGFLGFEARDSVWIRLMIAFCGITVSVCLYLAFVPPRSYIQWVRGRSAGEAPVSQ
ncbi:MAG: hypothetical protein MJE66_23390 [Proteobacteria bacterium]|nr:hypothetical protein [Pseudomonadota bacterium]